MSRKHVDGKNDGSSFILSLGNHTGGGLRLYESTDYPDKPTKILTIHGRFTEFNGRIPHDNAPYEGERFSIIFFVHRAFRRFSGVVEKNTLESLAFCLPGAAPARKPGEIEDEDSYPFAVQLAIARDRPRMAIDDKDEDDIKIWTITIQNIEERRRSETGEVEAPPRAPPQLQSDATHGMMYQGTDDEATDRQKKGCRRGEGSSEPPQIDRLSVGARSSLLFFLHPFSLSGDRPQRRRLHGRAAARAGADHGTEYHDPRRRLPVGAVRATGAGRG
jgi:hypothetical protein